MSPSPSFITFTIVLGFYAVLYCLPLLGGGTDTMSTTIQAEASQSGGVAVVARVAAATLVPAMVATLTFTPLLSFAYVGEVFRANAAGKGGGAAVSRVVTLLTRATLLAATLALLAGAVVQIGADGHLDRGRGDVARLNIK